MKSRTRNHQTRYAVVVFEFLVLYAFWFVLSGRYDLRNFITGACAAALVTATTNRFLYASSPRFKEHKSGSLWILRCAGGLVRYLPWLVLAVVKANIQVAGIILNPRLPIAPCFLQIKTTLRTGPSRVTLANSITLTPGTIVIDLKKNFYTLHALVPEAAGDLETACMQNKVADVFGELRESAPYVRRAYALEELE